MAVDCFFITKLDGAVGIPMFAVPYELKRVLCHIIRIIDNRLFCIPSIFEPNKDHSRISPNITNFILSLS